MSEVENIISDIGFSLCYVKDRNKFYRYKTNIISHYFLINGQEYQLLVYENVPLDFDYKNAELELEGYYPKYAIIEYLGKKPISFENYINKKFQQDIRKRKINYLLNV